MGIGIHAEIQNTVMLLSRPIYLCSFAVNVDKKFISLDFFIHVRSFRENDEEAKILDLQDDVSELLITKA